MKIFIVCHNLQRGREKEGGGGGEEEERRRRGGGEGEERGRRGGGEVEGERGMIEPFPAQSCPGFYLGF